MIEVADRKTNNPHINKIIEGRDFYAFVQAYYFGKQHLDLNCKQKQITLARINYQN